MRKLTLIIMLTIGIAAASDINRLTTQQPDWQPKTTVKLSQANNLDQAVWKGIIQLLIDQPSGKSGIVEIVIARQQPLYASVDLSAYRQVRQGKLSQRDYMRRHVSFQ